MAEYKQKDGTIVIDETSSKVVGESSVRVIDGGVLSGDVVVNFKNGGIFKGGVSGGGGTSEVPVYDCADLPETPGPFVTTETFVGKHTDDGSQLLVSFQLTEGIPFSATISSDYEAADINFGAIFGPDPAAGQTVWDPVQYGTTELWNAALLDNNMASGFKTINAFIPPASGVYVIFIHDRSYTGPSTTYTVVTSGAMYAPSADGTPALTSIDVSSLGTGQRGIVNLATDDSVPEFDWRGIDVWANGVAPTLKPLAVMSVNLVNDGSRVIGSYVAAVEVEPETEPPGIVSVLAQNYTDMMSAERTELPASPVRITAPGIQTGVVFWVDLEAGTTLDIAALINDPRVESGYSVYGTVFGPNVPVEVDNMFGLNDYKVAGVGTTQPITITGRYLVVADISEYNPSDIEVEVVFEYTIGTSNG